MGRKPINTNKKNRVVELVAVGVPDSQIMSDISGVSQSTLSKIKRTHGDIIESKKRRYIKNIDKLIGGDRGQAKKLKESLEAEQEVYNFKGQVVGTRPDYKIRLETVKYIDKLKGRDNVTISKTTNNNLIISKELDRYTR